MGILTSLDAVQGAEHLVDTMRLADDLAFEASRDGGVRTIRVLASALVGDDQIVAIAATHALAGVFDEQADVVISRLLSDDRGFLREHAAWALAEYGIRAIVAPSFNPIFRGNCVRTGILPAVLEAPVIAALAEAVAPDPRSRQIKIDLAAQTVTGPDGAPHTFEIAEEAKQMLLHALDAIDLTLELGADIDAFIACDRVARGWVYPTV